MNRFHWVRFKDRCEEEPDYYGERNIVGVWQSGFCSDGYPIMCIVIYGASEEAVERVIERVTKGQCEVTTISVYADKEEVVERHSQTPGGNRFLINEDMLKRLNEVGDYRLNHTR